MPPFSARWRQRLEAGLGAGEQAVEGGPRARKLLLGRGDQARDSPLDAGVGLAPTLELLPGVGDDLGQGGLEPFELSRVSAELPLGVWHDGVVDAP